MYIVKAQLSNPQLRTTFTEFLCVLSFCVLFLAFHPSPGAEAALFPHTHGPNEAEELPPPSTEEVFPWSHVYIQSSSSPSAPQTDQEESQGK